MNYNKSQSEAIRHKDGPMLVLAGPGSGKTAVITRRTQNLIEAHKVDPGSILVITFTRAAAQEMEGRFRVQMAKKTGVMFGTFHSVFFMILKYAYGYNAGNIITAEQKYQYMREILSYYHLDYQNEGELITSILAEISMIKNSRINLNHYYSTSCAEEVFRKIYMDYDRRLHQGRLLDYDDMLTDTYDLLSQRKDILQVWQQKFRYILVDEFQDINRIQYDIVRLLAGQTANLFVVGDDDQSIYRFRGSRPDIMLNFQKDYPHARQILLDINYRSSAYIIETAQNLIAHNKERFPKQISGARKEKIPVRYITCQNKRAEIRYLMSEISSMIEDGAVYSDFAILYRTNTQPLLFTEAFLECGIPFRIKDSIPNLYEHWIARDIFTYLRIADGSRAREDFLQIMNRPVRYLGRDSLCAPRVDMNDWKAMYREQPWIAERITKLQYDLTMMEKMSPYAAINYIRKGIGYEKFLEEYAKTHQLETADLMEILNEIQDSASGKRTLEEWQEQIRQYTAQMKLIANGKEQEENAVTFATLHSSKGLEFDTVYLIDVNEGVMPYKKAVLEKDIEEERRLFYVGMTRAKNRLTLCSLRPEKEKDPAISRFVGESKSKAGF